MTGDYSSMETFAAWFCGIFYGGIWLVLIGAFLGLLMEWKSLKKHPKYAKETESSDDFLVESDRVLEQIRKRISEAGACSIFTKEELKAFDDLKDSSEVASLFRFAHFAGCHLTFEQDECDWKDDPEYLNPDVFKTDLGEASALRKERKWNGYKRYYDPPRSRRDRALGR